MTEAVMRLEFRVVLVRQPCQFLHLLITRHGTQCGAALCGPWRFTLNGRGEHVVVGKRVEAAGRLGLIAHLVRLIPVDRRGEGFGDGGLVHGGCLLLFWGGKRGVQSSLEAMLEQASAAI